ncbi:MAG: HpcH/HpaI aldolase/citrate lyase family protein [Hyphomicrobiaceae bacterium]
MSKDSKAQPSVRQHRLRRTMLLTPGNQIGRLEKATQLDVDCVVFDLEDGVAPDDKPQARETINTALAQFDFGFRERLVRVNAIGTPEFEADIEALAFDNVDAVFVPKVERAAQLVQLDGILKGAEGRRGSGRVIDVVATIETPRGLLNALAIADAVSRTSALFFGSGDYAAATGSATTARAFEYPRATIAAAAAAADLQAIDAAYFAAVKDAEATRADAALGRELGFDGKIIFHPNQVAPCNDVFSPDEAEIAKARRIVEAHAAAVAEGRGVAYVDGTFLAIDIVLMAERVLRKAELVAARATSVEASAPGG